MDDIPLASHISNTRRHELTIAAIRAESEALFRSIGEGAIATDEFGHITRINPAALEILELNHDEALGKWFPNVVISINADGSPQPLLDRAIVRMFLTGHPVSEKLYYETKNGRLVPVSINVSPIIFGGRPVGAVEVFRDITQDNEIDRMKSEFISLASHQLRTPLSTIKTYAHMLDDEYMGTLLPDQARALKTIINASDTMNEIIGTLLNIARIESGSIAVNTKRFGAKTFLASVMKDLQLIAKNKDVSLVAIPSKHAILFRSDPLILKEVLSNLIGNAIKYTNPGGSVTVRIRLLGSSVVFEIKDTGMGIPKESQDKIFGKFFRAQNVVRHETSGTGLGLYVVKGLVQTLHGKVWFKSKEHTGTTFYVSLPLTYKAA